METLAAINWLDIAIMLTLIGGMVVGFAQGALRQLIALGALYISIIVSANLSPLLANQLAQWQPQMVPAVGQVISFFILIFITALILTFIVMDVLRGPLERRLGTGSRLIGGLLGLLLAAIFVSISLIAIAHMTGGNPWPGTGENFRQWLINARLRSNVVATFRLFFPVVIQAIRPWVPNLPTLLNIDIQV